MTFNPGLSKEAAPSAIPDLLQTSQPDLRKPPGVIFDPIIENVGVPDFTGITTTDGAQPVNPRMVAAEGTFWTLGGPEQDLVLATFFGDLVQHQAELKEIELAEVIDADRKVALEQAIAMDMATINGFRPDMRIYDEMGKTEMDGIDMVDMMTQRTTPITDNESDPALIWLGTIASIGEVVEVTEQERLRRLETPGLYFSHDKIGWIEPARRHMRYLRKQALRQRGMLSEERYKGIREYAPRPINIREEQVVAAEVARMRDEGFIIDRNFVREINGLSPQERKKHYVAQRLALGDTTVFDRRLEVTDQDIYVYNEAPGPTQVFESDDERETLVARYKVMLAPEKIDEMGLIAQADTAMEVQLAEVRAKLSVVGEQQETVAAVAA